MVNHVQLGNGVVHRVIDLAAVLLGLLRQQRVPQDAAIDHLHDVEHRADDALILTQRVGAGHRHIGVSQGRDHPELAVNGVAEGSSLPGGLRRSTYFCFGVTS